MLLGIVIAFFVVSMIGAVSAAPSQVLVAGKIYNADFSNVEAGASVDVTCMHDDVNNTMPTTMSLSDGSYSVLYDNTQSEVALCDINDTVWVHAMKTGVGENTVSGNVNINLQPVLDIGLGVVNVPLIPEFGLIAGLTTIVGAVGLFFYIRRKSDSARTNHDKFKIEI